MIKMDVFNMLKIFLMSAVVGSVLYFFLALRAEMIDREKEEK